MIFSTSDAIYYIQHRIELQMKFKRETIKCKKNEGIMIMSDCPCCKTKEKSGKGLIGIK